MRDSVAPVGRRSRTRERTDGASAPAKAPKRAAPAPAATGRRTPAGDTTRRTLGIYTAGAAVLAILVLMGIALLAGRLGSFIVVAYAAIGSGLLYLWASSRLAGRTLGDDDRVLQTVAGGVLIMAVGFAVVSAIVGAVA